jgi:predicted amidohydrolase YtcJ
MLVFSAADFEDFRQPRPDLPAQMESELEGVVRILAENRWPWRMHATYDETISRALDVFEKINREIPLAGLNWFFDHAETISPRSIDRIAALNGGIAVQHRMAYQGEYFVERYGTGAGQSTPPLRRILESGAKMSAGTDATRVASYNPWVSLAWLVTGRTVGGMSLYPHRNCLDRETALRMWSENVTWFSNEEGRKGRIQVGQLADLMVPDRDYFSCAEQEIADITSVLTIVGGRVVYGSGGFARFDDQAPPPAMPDWSPVRVYGGYGAWGDAIQRAAPGCTSHCNVHNHDHAAGWSANLPIADLKGFWGALGCSCWAI